MIRSVRRRNSKKYYNNTKNIPTNLSLLVCLVKTEAMEAMFARDCKKCSVAVGWLKAPKQQILHLRRVDL